MSAPWRRAFGLRLQDADGRLLVPWGWVLIGLLLTAATIAYDLVDSPFPRWQRRADAVAAAERLLVQLPERPEVSRSLPVSFVADRYADAYANYQVAGRRGVPLPDALPIWAWRVPLQGGRGYVAVNATTGEVTGLELSSAEAIPVASAAALDVAESLVRRLGAGGAGWDGPNVRPEGQATVYGWQTRQNVLGEAPEVAEVAVRDGRAVRVRRYVAVPAAFRQSLDAQEQRGDWVARGLLGWVELAGMFAAVALAIVWRRSAHWNFGLWVTAVVLALAFMGGLNSSLIAQTLHAPQLTPGATVALLLTLIIGGQALHAVSLVFGGAAGWAMAKATWGDRVAVLTGGLGRLLGRDGAVAGLRAYGLFVVHYQIAFWFYYFATKLGVWEATGLAFAQKLNLVVPALYPLQVVILAPLLEEVLWRLFAISALRRLFRTTFPAVLVPAVLWGLAHSWYQVYPPYTRAVELTLVGLLLGYAFVYWGLEVAIGSHLLYNALVTCVGLAIVPLPAQRAGAVLAGVLLLLPAVSVAVQLWRQRRASFSG